MIRSLLVATLFLCSTFVSTQGARKTLAGTYRDGLPLPITELKLSEDSTFQLTTIDPIFPYTYDSYTSTGMWSLEDEEVILNPHLVPRTISVKVNEGVLDASDSLAVKVNYVLEEYENDEHIASKSFDFPRLTLSVNKRKNFYNLVSKQLVSNCLFDPIVKNQIVLDSTQTVMLPRQDLHKIWVYSYGFQFPILVEIANPKTNYLEINIRQSIDKERMPRSKKVIVKGRRAYFYERFGKVVTSGILTPLQKREADDR